MGIKRLRFEAIRAAYSQDNTNPSQLNSIELGKMVRFLIGSYNQSYRKDHEERLNDQQGVDPETYEAFRSVDLSSKWDPSHASNFELSLFIYTNLSTNNVNSMLSDLGVSEQDNPRSQSVSQLFVLFRVVEKTGQIFALYTGNMGNAPVQKYTDFHLSGRIALRLLEPNKDRVSREKTKQVLGSAISSDVVLRPDQPFDPDQVAKIFTEYTARLRKDASLRAIDKVGLGKKKTNTIPVVNFHLGQGVVRIKVALSLLSYAAIVDHFAHICLPSPKNKTFLYQDPPPSRRQAELDNEEAFKMFRYYVPVPYLKGQALDSKLAESIANDMLNHRSSEKTRPKNIWDIVPPHIDDYFLARRIRIVNGQGIGREEYDWVEGEHPSYPELVYEIPRAFPSLSLSDKQTLTLRLGNLKLGFYRSGRWSDEPLLNCFMGHIAVENADGSFSNYFKINKQWYEVEGSLIADVAEEFRKLMSTDLIEEGATGYLSRPWNPQSIQYTLKKLALELKLKPDEVKDLCNTKVRYVDGSGKVLQKKLTGEILKHPSVAYMKDEVSSLLGNDSISKEKLEEACGKKFANSIWHELTRERVIGEVLSQKYNGSMQDVVRVNNPFRGATSLTGSQLNVLQKVAASQLQSMDEGPYNEGYLFDVHSETKAPFPYEGPGWITGDRIEPRGIEIFDILHYTGGPDRTLYLYHVKEGFNHKVRDGCSQMRNAARWINEARMANSKGERKFSSIIGEFFDEATKPSKSNYRKLVRRQLLALGDNKQKARSNFLSLFYTSRIVFVYAFVSNHVEEHKLTRKGTLPKESFAANDFTSEKTHSVAQAIFDNLVSQDYLTSEGARGKRFSELHQASNLTFSDPNLKSYRDFAWHVLLGDTSYYNSLIARMDLLQAKSQVRGLGFDFAVCQIKRPYNLAGVEEVPVGINWKVDETSSQLVWDEQEKLGPLFYSNPWAPAGDPSVESWITMETAGKGSCAFHALFGKENSNGVLECENIGNLRKSIVDKLRLKLKPTNDGFTDPVLDACYQRNITTLAKEAEKSLDGLDEDNSTYCLISSAKRVFSDDDEDELEVFTQYQEEASLAGYVDEVKVLFNDSRMKARGSPMRAVRLAMERDRTKLDDLKKALFQDEAEVLSQNVDTVVKALENSATGSNNWLSEPLQELKKKKKIAQDGIGKLVSSTDVMERFLTCMADPSYWLTDDEVQMVAHLRGLRVEIIRQDVVDPDGGYGCNNAQYLSDKNLDLRECVVVHASESHYSRCKRWGASDT